MLLAAPLLLTLLRCLEGGRASGACPGPSPRRLAPPERLRFRADPFQSLLLWAPGGGASSSGLLYDVQYKRYGNYSWTRVARCSSIVRQSCDLSAETLEPSRRYFARVRAVAPDGVSRWTPTGPFSPKEATPQLWNLNLALSGNILRVTLELSLLVGGENSSLAPEGLRPGGWGWYRVHVRRASTDTEYMRVENNQTFELPALLWGERYCVSVEPHLPSQPTPASWTKEECISTPPLTEIFPEGEVSLAAEGALGSWPVPGRGVCPPDFPGPEDSPSPPPCQVEPGQQSSQARPRTGDAQHARSLGHLQDRKPPAQTPDGHQRLQH